MSKKALSHKSETAKTVLYAQNTSTINFLMASKTIDTKHINFNFAQGLSLLLKI